MAKKRKRRKKKLIDITEGGDHIVRGKSVRGDFVLDMTLYLREHNPFKDVTEKKHREEIIDAMWVVHSETGVTYHKDPKGYHKRFTEMKKAVKNHPNQDPSQMLGGTSSKALRHEASNILMNNPELRRLMESDPALARAAHESSQIFRLPGPQTTKSARVQSGRELIVELYHRSLLVLREHKALLFDHNETVNEQLHNRLWALINESHIFEIKTELYEKLKATAVNHICAQAGIAPMQEFSDPPMGDREKFLMKLLELSEHQMMPENFPFQTMYFAMDRPLQMHPKEAVQFFGVPERLKNGIWVYAFLITPKEAYTLVIVDDRDKGSATISTLVEFGTPTSSEKRIWEEPMSFNSFIFPWFIDWVNSHQTTIDESLKFSYRRAFKKSASKLGIKRPIPRPFYTVYIKDEKLEEFNREQATRVRKKCEHRYDVRGAQICRHARGSLPLDPKLEKQLRRDKRRKIFITDKPDAETAEAMMKRGILPKRVDEWLAVLLYWRTDHRRGDPEGPYIPSIRKSVRDKDDRAA